MRAMRASHSKSTAKDKTPRITVAAFEALRIRYTDIARVVERTLDGAWPSRARELGSIFEIDGEARATAAAAVREIEC